jgi:hypothetical protein
MMKIVLLASYYKSYLDNFEQNHSLDELDYQQHREKLLDDYFGAFVSYRNYFCERGHDCELLIDNDFSLQQKWLNEHHINMTATPKTKQKVVMKQLELLEPDVLFVGSMFEYYGDFLRQVQSQITSNIFTWIACPFPANLDFQPVKCVLTSVPEFLSGLSVPVEKLAAAFDAEIVKKMGDVKKSIDVSFAGSLSFNHRYRKRTLEALCAEQIPLSIFGDVAKRRFFSWWGKEPLRGMAKPAVWGLDMYRTLAASRITLNLHIDVARNANFVGNMRMYEATGCGAMLLTDYQDGIESLFVPDKEIVTFRTIDELKEKVTYYLKHEEECRRIAEAGQKACLERHGYDRRIVEFEKIFMKYIA